MRRRENWKRDAVAHYFPMPNEIFALGLSSGAILVYTYLMYCEDRRTYKCHPSFRTIGEAIGMSRNTVQKYVRELEGQRLIETEQTNITTKNGRKHNGSLKYTVLPIQPVIDEYFEKQMRRAEQEAERAKTMKKLEEYDRKHPKTAV